MEIRLDYLEEGYFYHIYNRGINSCLIFNDNKDKIFFLKKLKEYVYPYAEIYAYCLMSNHYHFIIKVREFSEQILCQNNIQNKKGLHAPQSVISKQLGKLMSSYTQAYNKRYQRHGALLEKPFKRKRITDEEYLKQAIVYVHRNPILENKNLENINFCSYKNITSIASTSLEREKVIALFGNLENFIYCHQKESLYQIDF